MNGQNFIDLKAPGPVDRWLKREPRENAFIELNNLLASAPLQTVHHYHVREILDKYGVDPARAHARLLGIYQQILEYFMFDLEFSEAEVADLEHLKCIFGLRDD